MRQINLREANQTFSRLVREVEESGEGVLVLRNGKPAVEIVPTRKARPARILSPEQERAVSQFLKAARAKPGTSAGQGRWTRDNLHER